MKDANNILEKIDYSLQMEETPHWIIPILLCIRDDHITLRDHLEAHARWSRPVSQMLFNAVTAAITAVALWFLAGRLPMIFNP